MGLNVHDVLRKVIVYYTRKILNVKKLKMAMISNYYHLKR
jgi:hypothetical protein